MMELEGELMNIEIVQVYMPTYSHAGEEIEEVYEQM
jgi:hypothetical protein